MSNHRLASMPSAPYARPENGDNVPVRRTLAEMVARLPSDATNVQPFRTASGKPANAFIRWMDQAGNLIARYHSTDIVKVAPDGAVTITLGGWHTMSTRERLNAAFAEFNLPLTAYAAGRDRCQISAKNMRYKCYILENAKVTIYPRDYRDA
jgi:trans-aconitate methyltransferase